MLFIAWNVKKFCALRSHFGTILWGERTFESSCIENFLFGHSLKMFVCVRASFSAVVLHPRNSLNIVEIRVYSNWNSFHSISICCYCWLLSSNFVHICVHSPNTSVQLNSFSLLLFLFSLQFKLYDMSNINFYMHIVWLSLDEHKRKVFLRLAPTQIAPAFLTGFRTFSRLHR